MEHLLVELFHFAKECHGKRIVMTEPALIGNWILISFHQGAPHNLENFTIFYILQIFVFIIPL
jgi:hypothetical protein